MPAIEQRLQATTSGRAQARNPQRAWRTAAVGAGTLGLLASLAIFLVAFGGWLLVIVAGLTTALLSFDRRLGPLPAAMLVMLALPVGRGAEVGLALVGDLPVRPHDAAALVGAALVLPSVAAAVRRPAQLLSASAIPFTVFLLVGIAALIVGVLDANTLRDVVRDTRWWSLYAIGLLAILNGTPRDGIVRALVWGMTLHATLVLTAMLLPAFPGGLKLGAYLYDERMRLHYGQAIFLLPLATFAATRAIHRPFPWVAVLGLAAAAASITLTRALMAAVAGVVILAVAWMVFRTYRARGKRSWVITIGYVGPRVAAVALALAVGLAGGIGAYSAGIRIWTAAEAGGGTSPSTDRPIVDVSDRIAGQEGSDIAAQGIGRVPSYARAFVETSQSPLIGHGIGQLTFVSWTRGEYAGHTRNAQPGVDNAFLTVGLKSGAIGIAAFAVLLLWPLRRFLAVPRQARWVWYLPAWLGILGLSLIESFAVSGYAPFALSMLIALPMVRHHQSSRR